MSCDERGKLAVAALAPAELARCEAELAGCEAELAVYQDALAELFFRSLHPDDVAAVLASDPAFAAHQAYTAAFDPRMIDAQNAIVAVWARRRAR